VALFIRGTLDLMNYGRKPGSNKMVFKHQQNKDKGNPMSSLLQDTGNLSPTSWTDHTKASVLWLFCLVINRVALCSRVKKSMARIWRDQGTQLLMI